ncbi:MAG TPA: spore coat U domain-containing protein [Nevskiaceae bacterium]|nr:spore coat U domain-containing protein [Nevskiaceae bacterium]
MFKKVLVAGALIACTSSAVQASTTTTTFNVTATVISSCSTSASDLAFGNYDPLAVGAAVGTTTVTVTCSLLAPYSIGLSIGTNGVAINNRKMKITGGGTDLLNYGLYRDLSHTLNWGITTGLGGDTLNLVGTGLAVGSTVFGTIPAGQTGASVGSYTDTITVTITF